MIKIYFNEKNISIEPHYSLKEILLRQNYGDNYFAVAINQCFIPRTQYANTFLQEGDVIDIISPMQGG